MMRQVLNRQGRILTSLQAILFFAAMLLFIFTVVYRMVKSNNFSTAVATLIESLFIVAFFIFLGVVSAYLLYFIHERIRKGSDRRQVYPLPGDTSGEESSACIGDRADLAFDSDEKAESSTNS